MTGASGTNTTTRRRILAGLAATATVLVLGGCREPRRSLSLGTAENHGFFYDFGQSLSGGVARSDVGFTLDPKITGGSVENLRSIMAGELDQALVLADVAMTERDKLRAVGRLYLNYLQFAVPAASPIRKISDLRGRTISLGGSSATTRAGHLVLQAGGVDESKVKIRSIPITGVLDALASGDVDAALFAGGVPHPEMDTSRGGPSSGIRLLDLSAEQQVLQGQYGPVYQPVTLPKGLYASVNEVGSVGIATLLLARSDLPSEVVNRVVDILIRKSSELVPPGTSGMQYLDTRSLIYTSGVPLHPGAAEAYKRHHG
ncbi:TAXI family TRAP transporter solute-binding subunit [Arthrobacter sp. NyZ413]|uniref:TAXI family TRAP transporter solute-binding subunit n=1 Tax=Arthrobacter sp. NyZ413 TaxID=3144669 RepID=UPI003BF7BA64